MSHRILADVGTRWPHVRTAGRVAASLGFLFSDEESRLLVAAATLHDIGYSPRLAITGFHPLDGAVYLRDHGFSPRLAALVAHHSFADLTAPDKGILDLEDQFPSEDSLLSDALIYADMHSSPTGQMIDVEVRLTDIGQRHGNPRFAIRAQRLRAAVDRVEAALAKVETDASSASA